MISAQKEPTFGDTTMKSALFSIWWVAVFLAISSPAWGHETSGYTEPAAGIRGVFMFSPDLPGKWRVVVNDAMGHRLALVREVVAKLGSQPGQNGSRQRKASPVSRREGVIAGLAAIFGLSGMFLGWKARRSASRK